MATLPSPATWTDGPKITAAKLNLEVRDTLNFLINPPQAKASLVTTPISATTATWTLVTLNQEDWDNDGIHGTSTAIGDATSNSRLTCVTPGLYATSSSIVYANSGTGMRGLRIVKNGGGRGPAMAAATYTWASNLVTVTLASHGYSTGQKIYLDFTSGGATANDGTYTLTSTGANTFTVPLAGSGVAGNVVFGQALVSQYAPNATGSSNTTVAKAFDTRLTAGDYLELFGYQDSGGALNIQVGAEETFFAMRLETT